MFSVWFFEGGRMGLSFILFRLIGVYRGVLGFWLVFCFLGFKDR